jgi:hypothetical protein
MGLNLGKAAPEGDGAPEIEITPEMAEAGESIIATRAGCPGDQLSGTFCARDLAVEVYRAMWGARPQ